MSNLGKCTKVCDVIKLRKHHNILNYKIGIEIFQKVKMFKLVTIRSQVP